MKNLLLVLVLLLFSYSKELILPLDEDNKNYSKKALLGKKLFFESRLSGNNTISCASCHLLHEGGDDNRKVSIGIHNKKGTLNAPTIFNVRYNFVQFWDGRAKNLKEQILGPIHNPIEMGSTLKEAVKKLKKDMAYVKAFKAVFGDKIKAEYILEALVAFEHTLITPNSRFDLYLKGETQQLTAQEKAGFQLFKEYGCIACHNGKNLGGNLYQKMGVLKPLEYDNNMYLGRYNVTKNEEDRYFYKVPTLRNIQKTAPYFHNGEVKTLPEAVELMMIYQLGVTPSEDLVNKIVAFLKTLDGQMPKILEPM